MGQAALRCRPHPQCRAVHLFLVAIISCWQEQDVLNDRCILMMQITVIPHALIEIRDDYKEAIGWLGSIGFQIERGRLIQYEKILNNLTSNFMDDGWGDLNNDDARRKQITTMLIEVRELISIYKGLSSNTYDKTLDINVKHYIKGPFCARHENVKTSSNRPRNVGFELYLNALFLKAGFVPMYDTKADLSFLLDDTVFFLEAKRPDSIKNVSRLIDDANLQLRKRFKQSELSKINGIIALDLTKIINPEDKIMIVKDKNHLRQLMYNEDAVRINMFREFWHRKRHKKTVAVLLHYRLLTNFIERKELITLKWIGFVKFEDMDELERIHSRLNQAVGEIC